MESEPHRAMLLEGSKLNAAISAVMGKIRRLEKADENVFAKYKFTSIDDFKDMIRPLLSEHGLSLRMDESAFDVEGKTVNEKGRETMAVRVQFALTIYHDSGESSGADHITVRLPFVGPQTTGIARSYAMKEWIKTRFLASSGDIDDGDADRAEQQTYLPKKDAKPLFEALQKELREYAATNDPKALLGWASQHRSNLMNLPPDWRDLLRDEYTESLTRAKATEALDRASVATLSAEPGP
jgi:ERF superfamily